MRMRTLCCAALCFLVLAGCGPRIPERIKFNIGRSFREAVCTLGEYDALCWTVGFEPPPTGFIHDFSIDMTNPLLAIPTAAEDGYIEFTASGTFRARLIPKVSPSLLAGVPPPACAWGFDPVDGPSIGTLVVDWTVQGSYITTKGGRIKCEDGYNASNTLIKERKLKIQEFDIRDVWDKADNEIKDFVKGTIRAEIDRQVHSQLVLDCLFHEGPSEDAPIYAGGGESGFCR